MRKNKGLKDKQLNEIITQLKSLVENIDEKQLNLDLTLLNDGLSVEQKFFFDLGKKTALLSLSKLILEELLNLKKE